MAEGPSVSGEIEEEECGRAGKRAYVIRGQRFEIADRYSPIEVVGVGSYGLVISATDSATGEAVAIKKVDGVFEDLTDAKRILREIRLMRRLEHENLLPLCDMEDPGSSTFDAIYMYSPLYEKDLSKVISSRVALSDDHIKFFVYQMLCGLAYMHSASILHRDMKPANCLVTSSCDLAICDFGLSRYVEEEDEVGAAMTEYVVTRWFRPPELVLTQMYSSAVDIWALGCIFAQLMSGKPLFPGKDFKNQVEVICDVIGKPTQEEMQHINSSKARSFIDHLPDSKPKDFATLFPKASEEALDLLRRLLKFAPDDRMSAQEALSHPYLEEYRDEEFETQVGQDFNPADLEPRRKDGMPLTREDISMLILKEIQFFRPDMEMHVDDLPV